MLWRMARRTAMTRKMTMPTTRRIARKSGLKKT